MQIISDQVQIGHVVITHREREGGKGRERKVRDEERRKRRGEEKSEEMRGE